MAEDNRKKPEIEVIKVPNLKKEIKTIWVNSTLDKRDDSKSLCYGINSNSNLKRNPENRLIEDEFEAFCEQIMGFDFEEGYFHKITIEKIDFKTDNDGKHSWKLLKLITKDKDPSIGRIEKFSYWIGPEKRDVPCQGRLAPKDCTENRHIYQEGIAFETEAWKPLYMDITIDDYQEGYVYKVEFVKRYNSQYEEITSGPGFKIEDFRIVSKDKL